MFDFEVIGFEEENIKKLPIPEKVPLLTLRNTVMLPGITVPITVSRNKSVELVNEVYRSEKRILAVVAQISDDIYDPTPNDLYNVGVLAHIQKLIKMPDGNITVLLKAHQAVRFTNLVQSTPFLFVEAENLEFKEPKKQVSEALLISIRNEALKIIQLNPNLTGDASLPLHNINDLEALIYFVATNLNISVFEKQKLLEQPSIEKKANEVLQFLQKEIMVLELSEEIQGKIKYELDKQQREFVLRHQLKTIQEELNESGYDDEIEDFKNRAKKKIWTKEAQEAFEKEINKLYRLNPNAPEYAGVCNYIEWLLDLPWKDFSKDQIDLEKAMEILDKEHYGLEKVKKRIIEYLAVIKLKNDLKAPILCLYGPPGVGKTSLGKSIAKAVKRKFARIALGGVRDEAEIRGHRRTYIGAMPGKIIQALKKTKKGNPVIVLDEVDKVGQDWKGDPASALLEVLDPEQNYSFIDHFMEVEYDLSSVMFIATANNLDTIHPALRDRMEIIEINGYSLEEKLEIAKRHLIPEQVKEHGLTRKQITFEDEAIHFAIEYYTRESGVRKLTQVIAALCRGVAREIVEQTTKKVVITKEKVIEILGIERFDKEEIDNHLIPGVATGLAWTVVGGETLTIETVMYEGTGKITLSGQLGDVMKESANLAYTLVRANRQKWEVPQNYFKEYDVHLHIPAGAIPKDGPSAGVTMLTAIISLFTKKSVKSRLAMSGEITLRSQVLPVGGIKEKVLAAARAGVNTIILPYANQKDVSEIPNRYVQNIQFHFVKTVDEVLKIALDNEFVSIN